MDATPRDADLPVSVLQRVRRVCLSLPETYEEAAWVGARWRIKGRTFAHVLPIIDGKPQAHARAAGTDGPATVLTFRAEDVEVAAYREMGPPFFFGGWGRDVVGVRLDDRTDWDEVAELLTESYCVLAPAKLAAAIRDPKRER
jgi:hypothetical protein